MLTKSWYALVILAYLGSCEPGHLVASLLSPALRDVKFCGFIRQGVMRHFGFIHQIPISLTLHQDQEPLEKVCTAACLLNLPVFHKQHEAHQQKMHAAVTAAFQRFHAVAQLTPDL